MAVKVIFLEFEIHLSDPVPLAMPDGTPAQLPPGAVGNPAPIYTPGQIVKDLQDNPPGLRSARDLPSALLGVGAQEKAIIRSPTAAAVEFGGKVAYGTVPTPVLPIINADGAKPRAPYIYSTWFTSTNNFPRDVETFTRKSGGWFGIPFLFGDTTRYYWRGQFIYDAPADAPAEPNKLIRPPLGVRRWIDPGFANMGSAPGSPQVVAQYDFSRDAGRHVDTLGFAMRGRSTVRVHTTTENTTGGGATVRRSWERLYVRLRKAGAGELFWRCRGSVSNAAGCMLKITPTGQIALYNVNNVSVETLIGTTAALPVKVWKKLDIALWFAGDAGPAPQGFITLYLNGVAVITATVPAGTGLGQAQFHASSEIGTPNVDYTCELDIGFWMNSSMNTVAGIPTTQFDIGGLDFRNGSRASLVRASGASLGANWAGDFRTLCQFPFRDVGAANDGKWTSTTALAEIQLPMGTTTGIDAVPGSLGCVGFIVSHHGHKGTNNGQLGYKVGAGPRVLGTFGLLGLPNEGGADGSRSHGSVLYTVDGIINEPVIPFPALELHRIKGNDAVVSGTDHLAAVAEVIGTFNDEDYPPDTDVALRNPLPYLGPHNAPYPRTPWARQSSPPISPLFIKAGTYVGNGTGIDLVFKAPVHFLWIRHTTTSPVHARWFSSMTGASLGGEKTPHPWVIPDQLIDTGFVVVPSGGAPTGVGALPDRSAQVTAIVAANVTLLDGIETHKRDLLGIIIRTLNLDNPGDGNNWGYLVKTERDPDFTPADIIVWKPTMEHLDVLTDTGATWINDGIIENPAWIWSAAVAEGSQEQQTMIRIASADPEVNQAGQTYQYIAFSDPGQRFMLNGAIVKNDVNADGVATDALVDTDFLPLWLWFQDSRPGNDLNIFAGIKGPGHASMAATLLDVGGTTKASALNMALGTITLNNAINLTTDIHIPYSAWRMDDTSSDPGIPKVVKIGSYVGDGGAGDRTIPLAPVGLVRPLWAIVVPHGALAYMRDPSHAGTNSTAMQGSNSATAIKGGAIDGIVVGPTLNANGTLYNFFVIMGSATGNADGWSINGEFSPVEPAIAPGSQWGEQPEEPAIVDEGEGGGGVGPGGGFDDIDTDIAAACLPASTRVCNRALAKIGISKTIADLGVDLTEEATQMRLHYATELLATLRAFPWAFATKYDGALVKVYGTEALPVNDDWTYAYRPPVDCVFVRRIVTAGKRRFDPAPEMFRIGQDADGDVILTNLLDPTIEYTCRPDCSAGRGDALFKEALEWRLAAAAAPALTRVASKEQMCIAMFDKCIARASTVDSREQQQDVIGGDSEWHRGRN